MSSCTVTALQSGFFCLITVAAFCNFIGCFRAVEEPPPVPKVSGSEETSAVSEEAVQENAALLGLRMKDLKRDLSIQKVDDLGARQLAYVLSGANANLLAADLLECGGELVACHWFM